MSDICIGRFVKIAKIVLEIFVSFRIISSVLSFVTYLKSIMYGHD